MVAPQGKRKLERFLTVLTDEQGGAGLSPRMIVLVADARTQWGELDRRILAFDAEFVRWVKESEEARRLITIPGIGAIVASALVAAVGQAESFMRGRDLAAWLGLVPRQFTTGGKPKLLGISKRGNKYLRRQLIHGARARRCPMWSSATRRSADGRKTFQVVSIATLRSSPSSTSWPGSPGRCFGAENGSPSQECRWRRRLGRSDVKRPWINRGLREGDDGMA
jgi:transposase